MGIFFKKLKTSLGTNNPLWQKSAYYYNLYHNLSHAQFHPRKFRGIVIFFLSFIVCAIVLFVYGLAGLLTDSPINMNADTITALITIPIFIVLFALAFYFIVRYELKRRKKWKSYNDAWVNSKGTIIGKWWENAIGVDSAGGTDYYIAIEYNRYYKVKSPVSSTSFFKVKIGDKVNLRFVKMSPEVCEVLSK